MAVVVVTSPDGFTYEKKKWWGFNFLNDPGPSASGQKNCFGA